MPKKKPIAYIDDPLIAPFEIKKDARSYLVIKHGITNKGTPMEKVIGRHFKPEQALKQVVTLLYELGFEQSSKTVKHYTERLENHSENLLINLKTILKKN